MRLLPRDHGFSSIATSLSLAVANYKPIPQLPSSNTSVNSSNSSTASGASQLLPIGTSSGSSQQSFQLQSNSEASSYSKTHPESSWGEPSILYVPEKSSSSASQLASSKTVGPGKCPVISEYTPSGGWNSLPDPTYPAFDPVMANVYRYRQQQGVNLGSWFVQEGWMESNFMSCATGAKQAELDIVSGFGTSKTGISSARAYMEKHWDTWITEADFKKMQSMGINTVRIPIGYWSVGPYFAKDSAFSDYADVYYFSWRYVARAINWAAKYDIGVIIDLHGAYGGQNDQAHSGTSTGKVGFFTEANMKRTTDLLVWLANEISAVTNVVGIQLLNEPQNRSQLWSFYASAMDAMRKASDAAATVPLYFHDAFDLKTGASFVSKRKDFVVQDHHSYFVYTNTDRDMSATQHTSAIEGTYSNKLQAQSNVARRNVITGEWSCALSPSSLKSSKNKSQDQTNYCEAQRRAYQKTNAGWTFWTWTMENCDNNSGWCFQQAVKAGFLTTSFDSWGLAKHTKTYFSALVTSKATSVISSLSSKITAIPMPKTANSFLVSTKSSSSSARVNAASSAFGDSDDDKETDEDLDTSVPVNKAGFIGMVQSGDEDSKNGDEPARIGMVEHNGKRGVGSLAARASEIARRATSNAQMASYYGYNDGFKSARYFAGTTQLGRLGFAIQYRADSYRARIAAGNLQSGDLANYKAQYAAGVLAAEALIASILAASG